jgi:Zn-finger domain-containing protein
MRIFTLDEKYNVVCNFESTRSGFRHIAVLHKNSYEMARAKCTYQNRTWEAYEFESVLIKIINDNFEGEEREKFLKAIKWENLNKR